MRLDAPRALRAYAEGMSQPQTTPDASTRDERDPHVQLRMAPGSWNEDTRELDVVLATGEAEVRRYDLRTGEDYIERLDVAGIDLDSPRLNGMSVFVDHLWSADSAIGNIVPGSLRVEGDELRGRIRLTDDPDQRISSLVRRVIDGTLRNVSVGYRVHGYESEERGDGAELRTITSWELLELSVVGVPADPRAQTRAHRSEAPPMTTPTNNAPAPTKAAADPVVDVEAIAAEARKAERERVSAVLTMADSVGLDDTEARAIAADTETLDQARAEILERIAAREATQPTAPEVRTIRDEAETQLREACTAIGAALGAESSPVDVYRGRRFDLLGSLSLAARALGCELPDDFERRSRIDQLRALTRSRATRGMRVPGHAFRTTGGKWAAYEDGPRGLRRVECATEAEALKRAAPHVISDFPDLLSSNVTRQLLSSYELAPVSFPRFTRQSTTRNFRSEDRIRVSDGPALALKKEGAEITFGTLSTEKESVQAYRYSKGLDLSLEAIVNDDLQAFQRVLSRWGAIARQGEQSAVIAVLTANGNMSDGNPLFDAAHANIASGGGVGGAPSIDTVMETRALLRKQAGLDGSKLDLRPRFVMVPVALYREAIQVLGGAYAPTQASNVLPNEVRQLEVLEESRLDDDSTAQWYMLADPMDIDTLEFVRVEGMPAPTVDSDFEFKRDAYCYKITDTYGVSAIDWRGLVRNNGS